ncbi:MAG: 1-acyl-sn-glycerol-3-phosphate acyltransferase [Corallococcus sp.]|nr:1-acyl-sn-glycerol-3-phosphate acyltransferase [Corallococcus sp.]MCM1395458.1 1-acyl-sn-glycerol-3-phosphate acyltransferase [Corallococcus sp.]
MHAKIRYRYKAEASGLKKGPYLIVCNHQTTMDPFILSLSFKFPIYFMASDDLFNLKVSPLIRHLVAPIPKSKSFNDIAALKNVFRVIKEGGSVGVFPEGNRTISGKQWVMTDAIAKLSKALKVPLVIYNIEGGYGTDPRWGHSIRKGKSRGYVRRIISVEELDAFSAEELFDVIKSQLLVDDTVSGTSFKSRKRAEYIERALYMCPVCNTVSGIVSAKHKFGCKHCKTGSVYTEKLTIDPPIEGFSRIYEWYEWEREEIAKKVWNGLTVEDRGIVFRESVKLKNKKKLAGDTVSINRENLVISKGNKHFVYPLKDVSALTMVGKKKFNFYYGGKILQVKGNKRFCAIKYVHIFDGLRKLRTEQNKENADELC